MGNESLIIGVIIIVVTVIGGVIGVFVWHRLRRSRQLNGGIQMSPLQEYRSDGRRGLLHEEDRRTQNRNRGSPGLADIIGNSSDRPRDGAESSDGRSVADIVIPPLKRRGKASKPRLKKAKKQEIIEQPQDGPSTANTANQSSDRVRIFTTQNEQSTAGVRVKGKGKPAPGKFQRPFVSPENIDTPLTMVESSTSCSQEEGSLKFKS